MSSSLKTISLFTGAGGLDLGLHAAGFAPQIAVELDQTAVETLRYPDNAQWWAGCSIVDRAIERVSSNELLSLADIQAGEATLLAGGPPCQPFSKSGYWHSGDAKRLDDPRANTLHEFLRVLEDTLPEVFLLENVPGLAFSEKNDGIQLLKESIEKINRRVGTNYQIHADQLNAVEFGVPQTRERVFIIAHRDGKNFRFPEPTHTKPARVDMSNGVVKLQEHTISELLPFTTAWDAIGHLVGAVDPTLAVRGKWAELLPSIPEGHNYLYHTNRGKGDAIFGWRRRYWSMLLKLAKDRPSWTLTAQPGPAIGPFHWENRRLSSEELAALQTFPKDYVISGGVLETHKQLGNAVPSALAELLGIEIRRQLLGESTLKVSPSLIPAKRDDTPAPEETLPIPEKYRDLIGDHEDHPGEGLGPGATNRKSA